MNEQIIINREWLDRLVAITEKVVESGNEDDMDKQAIWINHLSGYVHSLDTYIGHPTLTPSPSDKEEK